MTISFYRAASTDIKALQLSGLLLKVENPFREDPPVNQNTSICFGKLLCPEGISRREVAKDRKK
jgi:hypothetical protein